MIWIHICLEVLKYICVYMNGVGVWIGRRNRSSFYIWPENISRCLCWEISNILRYSSCEQVSKRIASMVLIYICVNLLKNICVMNGFVGGGADPVSIFGRRRYRHQKQGDRHPTPHISPLAATNIHVYTFGSNKIHLNQMHSYVQCPYFHYTNCKICNVNWPFENLSKWWL